MIILVFILLVVAGAFAMFQWGDDVLLRSATPRGHFEAAKAGSGPDYGEAASWIARPGLPNDPSQWLPEGFPRSHVQEAAVFYVHPTTYLERDRWNALLHPEKETESRTRLFVQSQASVFNAAGYVWAPRYRQAAFGAFLLDGKDARDALNLAYGDVSKAFDRFVADSGERPIILAGHSQGALHVMRLLKDKVAGKPVAKRIAAAYVVGWPISADADLPSLGLPACRTRQETGCILSWMTFSDPANPELVLHSYEKSSGFAGQKRKRGDVLCVNPITGTQNGAAAPSANTGTLVPSSDFRTAALKTGLVGARCDKGLLIVNGDIPALGGFIMPGNNYHAYDYALFWGPISQDAFERTMVWLKG